MQNDHYFYIPAMNIALAEGYAYLDTNKTRQEIKFQFIILKGIRVQYN